MLTAEQHDARKGKIGGSDAAVSVGQSPRMTARALFHVMRGEMEYPAPEVDPHLLWLGHALEPVIHQWLAEQTGWTLRRVNRSKTSKQYPWAVGHPDRLIDRVKRGAEFKMRGGPEGWGTEGSDDIPEDVLLQCLHYLALYPKLEAWEVAVFFRVSGEMRRYTIGRDAEYIEQLMTAERIFMDHVKRGEPPAWDYDHPTTLELMKQVYPGTDGQSTQLGDDALRWWDAMEAARADRKEADDRVRVCKAQIVGMMGTRALGNCPNGETIVQKRSATNRLTLTKRRHVQYR